MCKYAVTVSIAELLPSCMRYRSKRSQVALTDSATPRQVGRYYEAALGKVKNKTKKYVSFACRVVCGTAKLVIDSFGYVAA